MWRQRYCRRHATEVRLPILRFYIRFLYDRAVLRSPHQHENKPVRSVRCYIFTGHRRDVAASAVRFRPVSRSGPLPLHQILQPILR
ncbi:hypothetical protein EVAR_78821_1 [Eumeta japonica]|uniref:Uncharacterized protein n=1 Tax=Eumeta variegata TaxID=151549 RepID=A0A4C1T4H2_EUMVA|nr:hypothetical protein EVAR_78821_1 [Eumeta japonica]